MGQPFNALLPNFGKKVSNISSMFYSQVHLMFLFSHQEETIEWSFNTSFSFLIQTFQEKHWG
jgi:hypothetical protein